MVRVHLALNFHLERVGSSDSSHSRITNLGHVERKDQGTASRCPFISFSINSIKEGSPSAGADSKGTLHLRTLITIEIESTKLQCLVTEDKLNFKSLIMLGKN